MRIYLDANVILDYLLDSRDPFHESAVEVMRLVASRRIAGGFSTTQATDLYYHLRKAAGDDVARRALRGAVFAVRPICDAAVRSERPAMEVFSIGLMLAHGFELFEYGYGKLCSAHSGCSPSRRIDMVHYTQ